MGWPTFLGAFISFTGKYNCFTKTKHNFSCKDILPPVSPFCFCPQEYSVLSCCGQLEKMLITLEPHGIFTLNIAYWYILRLSSVNQIKLNNNKQQTNVTQDNLTFFINPKKP